MRHGDANTYRKKNCRCDPCRKANSAERARYRKRVYLARGKMLVDPTGTARRLQALAALGWGIHSLADHLDMHPHVISRLRLGRRQVYRRAADAVTAVYERLSMTPGPDPKAAVHATRCGWLPPLAWDDDSIDDPGAWANVTDETDPIDPVVVERLCADPNAWRNGLPATRAERLAAAAILGAWSHKALGYSGTDARKGTAA